MKKIIALVLCLVIFITTTVTVFANGIQPYFNNIDNITTSFSITSTGKATVTNTYSGITGITKNVKIVTKIQKKFGLIWITVDCGEWTDTLTATNYSGSHTLQLLKSGTYRAHVEFTVSGTGGSDDKTTTNIERTYTKP